MGASRDSIEGSVGQPTSKGALHAKKLQLFIVRKLVPNFGSQVFQSLSETITDTLSQRGRKVSP